MNAPSPRVRKWLRSLTLPASRIYASAIASRNRRFDRGEGVQRIDRPVISVGNLTTGGTGKTPMVAWIARTLLEAGHHPAIAMRGYKSPRDGGAGDEELEYRSLLPQAPVVAHPDRVAALREFLPRHREIDCVILDDGFQHRRLHRDLDLVLIDAQTDTFHEDLLPAGNLREPPDALARASAVIITHAEGVDPGLAQEIDRWHGRPPLAWTRHAWTGLFTPLPLGEGLGVRAVRPIDGSLNDRNPGHPNALTPALSQRERECVSVTWLRGKRVLTLLGVGNPKAVIAQIEAAGAKVMADIPAGDHERFDRAKVLTARGLAEGLDAMIVTRKDWVKIEPIVKSLGGDWRTPIVVPQLEMDVFAGAGALQGAIASVFNSASHA